MNTEIDISNVTLHTGRMILRPWRQTDLMIYTPMLLLTALVRWQAGSPTNPRKNPK